MPFNGTWQLRLTGRSIALATLVALTFGAAVGTSPAAGRGEPGRVYPVRVELIDRTEDLRAFSTLDLDVDGTFESWARLYINDKERGKLERLGYRLTRLPLAGESELEDPDTVAESSLIGSTIPAAYHTYATLTSELQVLDADPAHDAIFRLSSIGQSVQGRELWMVQLSDTPDIEEDEPEVLYISSMHGDEVVGKELCIGLINYLLDNYGSDPRVTDLIDNNEIWIMPSMNPDGTEAGGRYNANNFDLNRNFPDYWDDPVNTSSGRQPETAAVMAFVAERSIHLSANFHGGALLANYGWDSNASGASVFSPMPDPDHPAMYDLADTYAENNLPMSLNSNGSYLTDGVTNGADWYAINGGMQDWGYVWHGKFDITIEVSQTKWPGASTLPGFWDDNLESLLSYLERGEHGLRGLVSSSVDSSPLAATVQLDADPFVSPTDPDVGDYHRYIMPGSYTMTVSAPAYISQTLPVSVVSGPAARYDVALEPLPTDLQPTAARVISPNQRFDPGGDGELALTLRNLGRDATAVTGRLIPTGWNADVPDQLVTWPDLSIDTAAESSAPYPMITIDPATPVGSWVGFAVEWQTTDSSGVTEPIFLEVGAPQCVGGSAVDVPQAIGDLQTINSQLFVADAVLIDSIEVAVNLNHTYSGDVVMTLISPNATEVVLHNRSGGSNDFQSGTYGVDLDAAESLDLFDGEAANGTWILRVEDRGLGDSGSLNGWSISMCGANAVPTPELRLRDLRVQPGGDVELLWWEYPGLDGYRVYRSIDASSAAAFVDVTSADTDQTDTSFVDTTADPLVFYLVTGVGPSGEGPQGHFGR